MTALGKTRGDSTETILHDNHFLIRLIADITSQPTHRVQERFISEHRDLGTNVREALRAHGLAPYTWSDRLVEFYEQTDAFLFESLAWNRTDTKTQMRRWIVDFLARQSSVPQRVLTYGDGIGFDSLELARAGHHVTYFDVARRCQRFARAVFERGGVVVEQLEDAGDIEAEAFDTVICLDVLEHVPDPPQLVRELSRVLRVGGVLVSHAPFYWIHPSVGTHLRSNTRFSGDCARLYRPANLHPIDGQFFWNPIVLEKSLPGRKPNRRLPMAPRVGGHLLAVARAWNLPHVAMVLLMGHADQRALQSLIKDLTDGRQPDRPTPALRSSRPSAAAHKRGSRRNKAISPGLR
jgi:SAM-dependent methyltransferase